MTEHAHNYNSRYLAYHLPPPQVIDGGDYIKCILPRPTSNQKYVESEDLQSQILALFRSHPELPTKEIVRTLGVARTTLHRALTALLKTGIIERTGHTKATRYRLTMK